MMMLKERKPTEMEEHSDASDGDASADSITELLESGKESNLKRKSVYEGYEGPEKKKKKALGKVRIPTVQELNELRETANLFNSNLFRMQIEEMLKEMAIKVKYRNLFQEWFEKLKQYLVNLPPTEEYNLLDTKWIKKAKIKPPVSFEAKNMEGNFRFKHPEDLTIGGSYNLQACVGTQITVDVLVQMPAACIKKRDYLNLLYVRKRALYLTVLADALQGNELVEEIHYVQAQGSPLKPLLELKPSGKLGQRIRVLLWPVTCPDSFKLPELVPNRGNIQYEWLYKMEIIDTEGEAQLSSPHYNSEIVQDAVWQQNEDILRAELAVPSIRDGLILLKVWLRQRRLDQGYGSFGGFVLAMYVAYLAQTKQLNGMMSSYQVARITWLNLANSNWAENGISLSTTAGSPPLSIFHEHFDVVFVDASGFCNICARVNKHVYFQVREQSKLAIKYLDTTSMNSFEALFMRPMNIELSCDHIIRFQDSKALERAVSQHSTPALAVAHGGAALPQLLHLMLKPLRRALGLRVKTMVLNPPNAERWPCCKMPPPAERISTPLILGLILNPEHAFSKLDRGPPATTPEADEFRAFWGERCQLRRFRDGGIHEALLWDGSGSVCSQVVQYILQKYMGLHEDNYLYLSNHASNVLKLPKICTHKLPERDAATREVIASFDGLTKEIRGVRGLPLAVSTIQGVSPVFRYGDVFPPLALAYEKSSKSLVLRVPREDTNQEKKKKKKKKKKEDNSPCLIFGEFDIRRITLPVYCPVIEAVMTLEHSSQWPRDLEAVQRLKAAICLQMAALLEKQFNRVTQSSTGYFDIYKDGFVFRIWLGYLREVGLLKEKVNEDGSTVYVDNPASRTLEEKIDLLPRLSSALHGVQQQFPGYAATVCLAKRWLSAQMLGPPHIPELVTELLVTHLYIAPEPFEPPVQGDLGFLRFLTLVSSTNWHTTPIMLNINGEFTVDRITELESNFNSSRKVLPPLFLATPYDKTPSQWTCGGAPSLQVLIRLAALASEALKFLKNQLLESSLPDFLPVFRPGLKVYDAVIVLRSSFMTRLHESIAPVRNKFDHQRKLLEKYVKKEQELFPIVNFDPVQMYLQELREGYSHCAMFFHDQYGGSVIGVLWKPTAFQQREFKVSTIKGDKLTNKSKVCLNREAILEDFRFLGKGLVAKIDCKTEVNSK